MPNGLSDTAVIGCQHTLSHAIDMQDALVMVNRDNAFVQRR